MTMQRQAYSLIMPSLGVHQGGVQLQCSYVHFPRVDQLQGPALRSKPVPSTVISTLMSEFCTCKIWGRAAALSPPHLSPPMLQVAKEADGLYESEDVSVRKPRVSIGAFGIESNGILKVA